MHTVARVAQLARRSQVAIVGKRTEGGMRKSEDKNLWFPLFGICLTFVSSLRQTLGISSCVAGGGRGVNSVKQKKSTILSCVVALIVVTLYAVIMFSFSELTPICRNIPPIWPSQGRTQHGYQHREVHVYTTNQLTFNVHLARIWSHS